MLLFGETLQGLMVASVQATHQIGVVVEPIIDPRNLSILALRVQSPQFGQRVLFTADVRSASAKGLVIDHDEQLMEMDGLVRLEEVIQLKFQPLGKRVETEEGSKLGTVGRWAFDSISWNIMKIHVTPTVGKSLGSSGLIVDRQQIVKVTDNRIVVKSAAVKAGSGFSWKKLFLGNSKPVLNPDAADTE